MDCFSYQVADCSGFSAALSNVFFGFRIGSARELNTLKRVGRIMLPPPSIRERGRRSADFSPEQRPDLFNVRMKLAVPTGSNIAAD